MSRMSPQRNPLPLLLVAAVLAACSEPATAPAVNEPGAGNAATRAAAVSNVPVSPEWQEQARALVAANGLSPYASGRVFAALGVAQYGAVVESDERLSADATLAANGIGAGGRSRLESRRGAVAGASAAVLAFFFPTAAASLEQRVLAEGGAGPGNVHPQFTRGLALGRAVGLAMVQRERGDGFTTPWTGTVPVGPGKWIAAPNSAPAGAALLNTRPWVLDSPDQFHPAPPPAFGSSQFVAARNEILALASNRTVAQTKFANDWNLPAGTFTPPGYWNLAAATYVQTYGLDERAATHVFALMHAAMFDAQIGCWEAKLTYWMLRPSQADPSIIPYLAFPVPNHPSYPSGHSCLSAAAGTVLTHFFPDRAAELSTLVAEAGLSRMYAGIHYRFDIEAGQTLGNAVATWAIAKDESTGLLAAIR